MPETFTKHQENGQRSDIERLENKVDFWTTIIQEARLDDRGHQKFLDAIGNALERARKEPEPIDRGNFAYNLTDHLLTITNDLIRQGGDEKELRALFANLRDDIWTILKDQT